MTSINRLTNKPSLEDKDLIPVWDAESGRTRNIAAESLKDYIPKIQQVDIPHLVSGTYSAGTLTLDMSDGSKVDVSGWTDLTGINFKEDGSELGMFRSVNFMGSGVQAVRQGDDLEVTIKTAAVAPTLALQFSGIYDDLQALKDAIPSPTDNQQAIALKPSEKYYHGVGGSWLELAPVGSFHPNYLGAYDTVDDLKAAEPSPSDDSLAIVGTTAKSFYIYTSGDWSQVTHTDLPSIDARLTDLEPKVASNINRLGVAEGHLQTLQSDMQKNVKDIAELSHVGKTFVFNGNSQPVWDTEAHGNHILTFRAMDQTLQLTPPAYQGGNPDGMIITIFNDDTDNAIRFQIPLLTGSNPNIPPENFASFVYDASLQKYSPMESGYIPVARINLANYVKNTLQAEGRIHTESELETAGFLKGMQVSGDQVSNFNGAKWIHFVGATVSSGKTDQAVVTVHGEVDPTKAVLHFQTIAERNQWSSANGSKYTKVVCIVDRDNNGFVAWYEWDSTKWSEYDAQGVIMSDSNGAIPKNIKTVVFGPGFAIQQAGDQEDAALVTYTEQGGSGTITLDDGTNNVAGIDQLDIKGMKVTRLPTDPGGSAGNAQITSGINWHMSAPNQQYGSSLANEVVILPPLNTYIDPDQAGAESVKLEIKPGTFEEMHSPSFLAYLQEPEEVIGKMDIHGAPIGHPKGAVWFDDVVVPSGPYILLDKINKAYGIQEADELDPNVSGGMNYLICYRMAFKGKAPSDGFVRIFLMEKRVGTQGQLKYLEDVNGHPMAVERYYRSGDELGHLDVIGVVNAKGIKEFQCLSEDSFTDDMLNLQDRENGASGLMIQAIKSDDQTGRALLQFMHDTGQDIIFNSHYLGPSRMDIDWMTKFDQPLVDIDAGTVVTQSDGMHSTIIGKMKAGIQSGHMVFQDNGSDIADFNFGKIFGADETRMLRGKQVQVSATLTDKQDAYNIGLFKWTGKPDEHTDKVFTGRQNVSLVMEANWTKVDTLFISEDVVSGDHDVTKTFTVPADANNYAILIYPAQAQSPMHLQLKHFKLDVVVPFIGFDVHTPLLDNEKHLILSDEYKKFVQDNQSFASLRYTINQDDTNGLPMPIGMDKGGNADIELDTSASVANVSGSMARGGEGCIKFNADGNARIVSNVKLWNEKGTDSTVKFWWAQVSPDGNTVTKLPDSVFTATVKVGAKGTHYSFGYDHDFEQGNRLSLRASADSSDGAFLQATPSVNPMLTNYIEFKELKVSESGDDDELISAPIPRAMAVDRRVHSFTGNTLQNLVISLDIPSDVELSEIEVVKHSGTKTTSIKDCEYVYDSSTKKLTVHVGSGVTEGKIYLTFWSAIA